MSPAWPAAATTRALRPGCQVRSMLRPGSRPGVDGSFAHIEVATCRESHVDGRYRERWLALPQPAGERRPQCLAAARGLAQPAPNSLIGTQASVQAATNRDDALADAQATPLLEQVGGHPLVTAGQVLVFWPWP